MRASDLIGARAYDADGAFAGRVSDVRVVQDGPVLGTWGAAFRVAGIVVTPRRAGSFIGYERGAVDGPWLVAKAVTWLHRGAKFARWDDVESCEDGVVRLRRRIADLDDVPPLS